MASTAGCRRCAPNPLRVAVLPALVGLLGLSAGCGRAPGAPPPQRATPQPDASAAGAPPPQPTMPQPDAAARSQLAAPGSSAPPGCPQLSGAEVTGRLAVAGVVVGRTMTIPSDCAVTGPGGFAGVADVEVLDSVDQARLFFADPQWDVSLVVDGPTRPVHGLGDEADFASQGGPAGWSLLVTRRGATVFALFTNQSSKAAAERTAAAILTAL